MYVYLSLFQDMCTYVYNAILWDINLLIYLIFEIACTGNIPVPPHGPKIRIHAITIIALDEINVFKSLRQHFDVQGHLRSEVMTQL